METTLYRLFYVSKKTVDLSEEQVDTLAERASVNNREHNIVGALCFNGNHFGQLLEGPRDEVYRLVDRIREDERHQDMLIVGEKPVRFRVFKDWHMKRVRGMDFNELVDAMAVE